MEFDAPVPCARVGKGEKVALVVTVWVSVSVSVSAGVDVAVAGQECAFILRDVAPS